MEREMPSNPTGCHSFLHFFYTVWSFFLSFGILFVRMQEIKFSFQHQTLPKLLTEMVIKLSLLWKFMMGPNQHLKAKLNKRDRAEQGEPWFSWNL